jgi:hypothetical protein
MKPERGFVAFVGADVGVMAVAAGGVKPAVDPCRRHRRRAVVVVDGCVEMTIQSERDESEKTNECKVLYKRFHILH